MSEEPESGIRHEGGGIGHRQSWTAGGRTASC